MGTERVAAIILLVGSVLFIIAAFMPVSQVFAEPSPAAKLEIRDSNRIAWTTSQVLFGLGASIAAIGLGFRCIPSARHAGSRLGLHRPRRSDPRSGVLGWARVFSSYRSGGVCRGRADRLAVSGVCATYAGWFDSLRRRIPAGRVPSLARRCHARRSGYLLYRLFRLKRHPPVFLLYPDVHGWGQAHAMRKEDCDPRNRHPEISPTARLRNVWRNAWQTKVL